MLGPQTWKVDGGVYGQVDGSGWAGGWIAVAADSIRSSRFLSSGGAALAADLIRSLRFHSSGEAALAADLIWSSHFSYNLYQTFRRFIHVQMIVVCIGLQLPHGTLLLQHVPSLEYVPGLEHTKKYNT